MDEFAKPIKTEQRFQSSDPASMVASVLFGLGLLSILFYVPGPIIPVSHPYKAELVLACCLLIVWILIRFSGIRLSEILAANGKLSYTMSLWLTAFTFFGAISVLWAGSFESVFHHTSIWGLYVAAFITFTAISKWQREVRFAATALATAASVTGILCLIDYLTMEEFALLEGFIRIRYGKYSELMAAIMPLLVAAAIEFKGRQRIFFAVSFVLAWLVAMLSLSKGGFLAGIAGLALFFIGTFVTTDRLRRKVLVVVAALWLIFTIGFQYAFSVVSDVPSTSDYISGTADPERGSTEFRKVIWKAGTQMAKDRWLIGWGADNYGRAFNEGRTNFRRADPTDTAPEFGEDYIVERAHNEPLQILVELGMIGLIIFITPFVILMFSASNALRKFDGGGIVAWGCVAGMVAFAASSMVSSFSFRSAQNGIAFFLLVSVLVAAIDKNVVRSVSLKREKVIFAAMISAIFLVFIYSGMKIAAEYFVDRAENTIEFESAKRDFETALMIDPEYAGAYLSYGARLAGENDRRSAAEMMVLGTKNGIGLSLTYSQIAKHWIAAGEIKKADKAYLEALEIYPRSVYLWVEYATFLESIGRNNEANASLEAGRAIDLKAANSWYLLIREGGLKTFEASKIDPGILPPAYLKPQNAVIQYSDQNPISALDATQ